jgi:glycyl-tRNA synthetase beta chain
VRKSLALYGDKVNGGSETVEAIIHFIKGRFSNDCISRGFVPEAVDAAVSVSFDNVNDCLQRIKSIETVSQEPAFKILAASYKRIRNIIKDNSLISVSPALFEHKAESDLYALFLEVSKEMERKIQVKDYSMALKAMLKMKEPVDTFFDEVMVMADDMAVRQNRLNLLTVLGDLILQIGDISKLQEN